MKCARNAEIFVLSVRPSVSSPELRNGFNRNFILGPIFNFFIIIILIQIGQI